MKLSDESYELATLCKWISSLKGVMGSNSPALLGILQLLFEWIASNERVYAGISMNHGDR